MGDALAVVQSLMHVGESEPCRCDTCDALARVLAVAEAAIEVSDGSFSGKHDPGEFAARRRKLDAAVAALRGEAPHA